MISIVKWLENRKLFNSTLVVLYFVAIVLPHKSFGTWINHFFLGKSGISRDQYDDYVASVAIILLIIGCVVLYFHLKRNKQWKKIIFYLICSILLAVLIMKILFVINIEVVHFPQYAFFTILIFPLVKRYQSALIWATIAGAFDEAYQYFYLAPNDTGYYDFNDVLTNLVGASFGLIILRSFDIKNSLAPSFLRRNEIQMLILLTILIALLFWFSILGIHSTDEGMFPIIKKQIEMFWTTIPPGIRYHVVKPWEGLMGTILLWCFYWKLGRESN